MAWSTRQERVSSAAGGCVQVDAWKSAQSDGGDGAGDNGEGHQQEGGGFDFLAHGRGIQSGQTTMRRAGGKSTTGAMKQ